MSRQFSALQCFTTQTLCVAWQRLIIAIATSVFSFILNSQWVACTAVYSNKFQLPHFRTNCGGFEKLCRERIRHPYVSAIPIFREPINDGPAITAWFRWSKRLDFNDLFFSNFECCSSAWNGDRHHEHYRLLILISSCDDFSLNFDYNSLYASVLSLYCINLYVY